MEDFILIALFVLCLIGLIFCIAMALRAPGGSSDTSCVYMTSVGMICS